MVHVSQTPNTKLKTYENGSQILQPAGKAEISTRD
jgi:hypothetical protein